MNSRISAGSTVVDGGLCQPNSPLRNVRSRTVKNSEPYFTARLTFIEPYQRQTQRRGEHRISQRNGSMCFRRVALRTLRLRVNPVFACSAWFAVKFMPHYQVPVQLVSRQHSD